QVLLKVSPWKGVIRFGKKGNLTPRYVGPFEILERVGPVAYRLRLSEELSSIHDTFHVSKLKKYLADANMHLPLDEIKVNKTLCFLDEPVEIIDREVKSLKRNGEARIWLDKEPPRSILTWEDLVSNALNPNDQDALDSAAGGNFLDMIPRECLSIIESKSKVRYSRSRVTDVRANGNAPPPSSSH
nr:putative reverse transcriptase domain-containing protein [Tanacetum cinerariifolium]